MIIINMTKLRHLLTLCKIKKNNKINEKKNNSIYKKNEILKSKVY